MRREDSSGTTRNYFSKMLLCFSNKMIYPFLTNRWFVKHTKLTGFKVKPTSPKSSCTTEPWFTPRARDHLAPLDSSLGKMTTREKRRIGFCNDQISINSTDKEYNSTDSMYRWEVNSPSSNQLLPGERAWASTLQPLQPFALYSPQSRAASYSCLLHTARSPPLNIVIAGLYFLSSQS